MSDLTLTEFLLSRIYEDEAAIHHLPPPGPGDLVTTHSLSVHKFIARWNPERALAECAVKRAIVGQHYEVVNEESCGTCGDPYVGYGDFPCATLRLLGSVYSEHEDYLPEWRPNGGIVPRRPGDDVPLIDHHSTRRCPTLIPPRQCCLPAGHDEDCQPDPTEPITLGLVRP